MIVIKHTESNLEERYHYQQSILNSVNKYINVYKENQETQIKVQVGLRVARHALLNAENSVYKGKKDKFNYISKHNFYNCINSDCEPAQYLQDGNIFWKLF